MLETLKNILDIFIVPIAPAYCGLCGECIDSLSLGKACHGCWSSTRIFNGDEALCPKCGRYLVGRRLSLMSGCRLCRGHHYDSAISCGIYEYGLAVSVIHLKTESHIPEALRAVIESRLNQNQKIVGDLLIPVPLSRGRFFERGFNQAEVIARLVGHISSKSVDSKSLIRRGNTGMHRVAMDRTARKKSVEDIFSVVRPKMIDGKHVTLIDDVLTSGATLSACAEELKKAGASRVTAFTIARTR